MTCIWDPRKLGGSECSHCLNQQISSSERSIALHPTSKTFFFPNLWHRCIRPLVVKVWNSNPDLNGDQFLSTPSPCHNVKAGVGWPFCFKKEVPRNVCAGAGRTGRPNWLASRALRLRCVVWSSNCSYLLPLPTNCLAATSRSPQFELNVHRSYGAVVLQGRRLDLKKNLTFRIHIFGGF